MKYIVLIGDGMAGRPLKQLGGKTCLQKAHTPNMDMLASSGEVGTAATVPPGFEPGSDVANLSILGYDPKQYYTGRAPIEALYRGISLGAKDVAFRCNLVTLESEGVLAMETAVMRDFSAGHISTKDAGMIIRYLKEHMGTEDKEFYAGMSYRHLMIWKNGEDRMKCTPPHDISGKKVFKHLPSGKSSAIIKKLMTDSIEVLQQSPVNASRVKNGHLPASSIWLWGQGKRLNIPTFKKKNGLSGALISAVDLTKGLGIAAGLDVINVRGATGYIDTNYEGKARAALKVLKDRDFVYVHVEAPDEAGHNGDIAAKLQAIEDFDKRVVGNILKGMKKFGDYRVLLMPDHFTPISIKTHTADPVPFVIYRSDKELKPGRRVYSEGICRRKGVTVFEKGHLLMDYFLLV
ncbi:MAG: cofactor-independent phosphoglycerate mutase [Nitrospira sp.]|nr:cofactor-independent phosphoglycerate mutase [Nitrospira sp.]